MKKKKILWTGPCPKEVDCACRYKDKLISLSYFGIEAKIAKIESFYYKGSVPGTTIYRVILDRKLFKENGINVNKKCKIESKVLWCLAVGEIQVRHKLYYGFTISKCINKALKDLKGKKK